MNTIIYYNALRLILLTLLLCPAVNAGERIAILDFELIDITSLPNTQTELDRTASIKPLLEQAILHAGDYQIIAVGQAEYQAENAGPGYLYRFHDIAAKLGEKYSADWIVVGQHSKPSFLFSYLMANLIDVKQGRLIARIEIELKGNHQKVTRRGVRKLSTKIDKLITQYPMRH